MNVITEVLTTWAHANHGVPFTTDTRLLVGTLRHRLRLCDEDTVPEVYRRIAAAGQMPRRVRIDFPRTSACWKARPELAELRMPRCLMDRIADLVAGNDAWSSDSTNVLYTVSRATRRPLCSFNGHYWIAFETLTDGTFAIFVECTTQSYDYFMLYDGGKSCYEFMMARIIVNAWNQWFVAPLDPGLVSRFSMTYRATTLDRQKQSARIMAQLGVLRSDI